MGITVEINSLEEMCDMMCDNVIPEKKQEWWIFTFGSGQEHEGKYVRIKGTYFTAREKMFDRYGEKWGFQYSEKEWEDIKNDPQRWWPIETELEVIE